MSTRQDVARGKRLYTTGVTMCLLVVLVLLTYGAADAAPIVNPGFEMGLTGWRTGGEEDVTAGGGGATLFVHLEPGAETALFQLGFDPLADPLHYLVTFATLDPDGLNYLEVSEGGGGLLDPWGVRIDATMPGPVEVVIPAGAEGIHFLLKQEGEYAAGAVVILAPTQVPAPSALALLGVAVVMLVLRSRAVRAGISGGNRCWAICSGDARRG